MVITWYGQACFRIQSGRAVVVVDPFDKSIGLTPPRFEAGVVLVTHGHKDHNNTKAISGDPFIVEGPGEYERSGIKITGISSFHDENEGKDRGVNTMYVIGIEGMHVAHLGDLGQKELTDVQHEALGDIDVLLMPVGGVYTVGGKEAASIVNTIGPKIVIPMHYNVGGLSIKLEDASQFLKELGHEGPVGESRVTIKKSDLPQERMEVVVLSPNGS